MKQALYNNTFPISVFNKSGARSYMGFCAFLIGGENDGWKRNDEQN